MKGPERFRRLLRNERNFLPLLGKAPPYVRVGEARDSGIIELMDDGRWGLSGGPERLPK